MPAPVFPGHVCAPTSALAAGSALSAAATCAAVDDKAPVGPVDIFTTISKTDGPVDVMLMLSGELATPGSLNRTRTVDALCRLSTTRALSSLVSATVAVTVCAVPRGPVAVAGVSTSVAGGSGRAV